MGIIIHLRDRKPRPSTAETTPPPPPMEEEEHDEVLTPWETAVGRVLEVLVQRGILQRHHGLAMLETLMELSGPWDEVPVEQRDHLLMRLERWDPDLSLDRVALADLVLRFGKQPSDNDAYVQECLRRAVKEVDAPALRKRVVALAPQFAPPEPLAAAIERFPLRLAYHDSDVVWNKHVDARGRDPVKIVAALRAIFVELCIRRILGPVPAPKEKETPKPSAPLSFTEQLARLPWLPNRKPS